MKKLTSAFKFVLPVLLMVGVLFPLVPQTAFATVAQKGTATSGTSTGTTLTIAKPTGVVAGDVMLVSIAMSDDNDALDTNPSLTGWSLVAGADLAGITERWGAVLYKVAGASEPASYIFTLDAQSTAAVGSIVAFSGVDVTGGVTATGAAGGPFDVDPGSLTVTDAATASAASITTVSANAAVIMLAQSAGDNPTYSGWTTATSPGALTELSDFGTASNEQASVGIAWAIKTTAGSTGIGSVTLTPSERSGGILVALKMLKTTPTVSVTNSPQTYTGSAIPAVVTGSVAGVVSDVKYNGSTTVPTDAGTYTMTADFTPTDTASYNTLNDASAGTFTISKATPTASITNSPVNYNGGVQTATVACLGGGTATLASGGTGTNAGSYPATVNCATSTNYNAASGLAAGNFVINQVSSTTAVSCPTSVTYTGVAQTPCSVSVTGAGGLSLTPAPTYLNNTNAGINTASASYTYAGDTNHTGSSDSKNFSINKANADCTGISGYSGVYDGASHGASGSCVGVGSDGVLSNLSLGSSFTDVPGGTANWTFTDVTGNYNDTFGGVSITITKANPVCTITPYNVPFDGAPHTANGSCKDIVDVELVGLSLVGTTHTNAGTYNGDAWAFIDVTGNYNDANGTVDDAINKANAVCTISPDYSVTYDGATHGATGSCVGVGTDLTPSGLDLGSSFTNVPGDTAFWDFTNSNYNHQSGSVPIEIVALSLTGNFTADNKVYDGNNSATVLSRTVVPLLGDDVTLVGGTATFDNANVGTGKTVTLVGATLGGADLGNYSLSSVNTTTANITQATSTVTVDCPNTDQTYTGLALTPCTASYLTSDGLTGPLSVDYTANTNVGVATGSAEYLGDSNHEGSTNSDTFNIIKASSTTVVTCPVSAEYDGTAKTPCSASVTGAGGLNESLTVNYTNNTNVGTAGASATYTGDDNHTSSSDSKSFDITQASSATVVTCPASVVYTGVAQTPCSVSVTGAGGLSLTPDPVYADNTIVGTASASYTYGGDANHSGSNDSETFDITLATSATVISCPVSQIYTGSPIEPCTATVTGAGGLNSSVLVTYDNNTNVGTATAHASYAGDSNHSGSTAVDVTFSITKATSSIVITNALDLALTDSVVGEPVTVSWSVDLTPSGGTPTGTVTIKNGGTPVCSAPVLDGGCTITTFTTPQGTSLIAVYSGDANITGSISTPVVPHTVVKADTTTTITNAGDLATNSVVGGSYLVKWAVEVNAPGSSPVTGTVSITGGSGCSASVAVGECSLTSIEVGNKTLVATYSGDSNLNGSASAGTPHTVDKAVLTITADDKSKVYGDADPAFTFTPSGFIGGVDGTIDTPPTCDVALPHEDVNTYPIECSGGDDANYSFNFVNGTLTVTQAGATVVISDLLQTYDGTPKSVSTSTTPLGLTVDVTYDLSPVAPTDAGSYAVVATIDELNYSGSSSGTLIISKATPVITWADPASIESGTALSGVQLNAIADVAGVFTYTPISGTVLGVGAGQNLHADFVPTDTINYNNANDDALITVVDTTAPVVSITNPLDASTTSSSVNATYTVDDGTATIVCKLDTVEIPCGATSVLLSALSDGSHTFEVTATDASLNAGSDSITWTVDATGPVVVITSPADAEVTLDSGNITYTVGDSTSLTCTLDSVLVACTGTSYPFSGLLDGSHTFTIFGEDSLGNEGALDSVTWEVDAVGPVITLQDAGSPTDTTITVTWTTDELSTSRVVYDTVSHDGSDPAPNYGYAFSTGETNTGLGMTTTHSVVVTGLTNGTTYYFRGVSHGSPETISDEVSDTTTIPAPATGTIKVCKVILDDEGNVIAGAPGTTFTVPWLDANYEGDAIGTPNSAVFTTPLNPLENVFGSVEGECVTYEDVAVGRYYYGEEQISSGVAWETPLYNDQVSGPVDSLSDMKPFNSDLDSANDDFDGVINVSANQTRTLIVLNQLKEVIVDPNPDTITISAVKIVCDAESDLPNWGLGGDPITLDTAQDFLDADLAEDQVQDCHLADWTFEWGNQNAGDPGRDYVGEAPGFGYTPFTGSVEVPLAGVTEFHLREVLKAGYIPFTFDQDNQSNEDNVSAEFYCSNDVLNYDNYDFIRNPVAGNTYHCIGFNVAEPIQCVDTPVESVIVSDTTTLENGDASVPVPTPYHANWTASIPGATWIWGEDPMSDTVNDLEETFTKTFTVDGTPTGGILEIAADNSYEVILNNQPLCSSSEEDNYSAEGQDTCLIDASDLQSGLNTIEFKVKNWAQVGGTEATNPAGLLYKLTLDSNECVPPPPTDVCPDIDGVQTNESECVDEDPTPTPLPQCSDGIDNDGDGETDYGPTKDQGCDSPEDNDETGGDNGSGSDSGSRRSGSRAPGIVLGAQDSVCNFSIDTYMRKGYKNNSEQVKVLQTLLNKYVSAGLGVDGAFGPKTEAAVKAFQLKYGDNILKPWGLNSPTGIFFRTTLVQAKNLECPVTILPIPTDLINWSQSQGVIPPTQ